MGKLVVERGRFAVIECPVCRRETRHELLCRLQVERPDARGPSVEDLDGVPAYWYWDEYQLLECAGCGAPTVRAVNGSVFPGDGELDLQALGSEEASIQKYARTSLFPPRKTWVVPISGDEHLPAGVRTVYLQLVSALKMGNTLLGAIGMRTVLERVCIDAKVAGGGLAARINGLREKGLLTERQSSFLHGVRLLGNEAAHEALDEIADDEMRVAMEILNNLLMGLYVLPKQGGRLDSRRDPTQG